MARIYGKLNTAKMQAVLYFNRKRRLQRIVDSKNSLLPDTLLAADTEMGDFK